MIEAKSLIKRYGVHTAVNDVSFTIEKGEIVGFLGPNGAGKSTTMNILTGYLSATDGSVYIGGLKLLDNLTECKAKIGYLPENPPLYFDMTVREYLKFVAEIKKVPKSERAAQIESVLTTTGTLDVQKRLIKNLSKGYKQRVGLAQALLGNPEILILDEPTSGLDPAQIIEIRDLIIKLGKEHTIILSSHILPEISAVCKRVLIINEGNIVADDTPENLAERLLGSNHVLLRVAASEEAAEKALKSVPNVTSVTFKEQQEPDTVEVVVEAEKDTDIRKSVFKALSSADLPILQMRALDMTLEDIFLHLTTKEKEAV